MVVEQIHHGANTLFIEQRSFAVRRSTWCLPITARGVPGLCYDTTVTSQPYDRISVIEFGKALFNWALWGRVCAGIAGFLLVFGPVGFFAGGGVMTMSDLLMRLAGAFVVLALIALVVLLAFRPGAVRTFSAQNGWPLIGGYTMFPTLATSVISVAQALVSAHARARGLEAPDLANMPLFCMAGSKLGSRDMVFNCRDYLVVRLQSRVPVLSQLMPCLFNADSYSVIPKQDVVFVRMERKGRWLGWVATPPVWTVALALVAGVIAGADDPSANIPVAGALGVVLGLVLYILSAKQHLTVATAHDGIVQSRIPASLSDAELASYVLQGAYPGLEFSGDTLRGAGQPLQYAGTLPEMSTGLTAKSVVASQLRTVIFIGPIVVGLFAKVAGAILTLPCSLCTRCCRCCTFTIGSDQEDGESVSVGTGRPRRGARAATLSVYPLHIETYARNMTVICCCAVRGGTLHTVLTNVYGWGSDRFFSPINRASVAKASVPGARMSMAWLGLGFFSAVVLALFDATVVAAAAFGVCALVAAYLFLSRRATLYIGDHERNSVLQALGREAHHVEFTALDAQPDEIVLKIMERFSAAADVAGVPPGAAGGRAIPVAAPAGQQAAVQGSFFKSSAAVHPL